MLLSLSSSFLGFRPASPPRRLCRRPNEAMRVYMRDRSKNRKPLQKGRNLSIEAIQAVQALKLAMATDEHGGAVERVMQTKVRRLIKFDLMAVLDELQRQGQGSLALQVFEEVRREHWYKPQLSVYADMVRVLANSSLSQEMEILMSYLKVESFKNDTQGLNALLESLLEYGFSDTAMDCFHMMNLWETDPNESTFQVMIRGLERNNDFSLSATLRDEAINHFGVHPDFLKNIELENVNSSPGLTQDPVA